MSFARRRTAGSYELQPPRRIDDHAQQQKPVLPPTDVCLAVRASAVANREIDDAMVQLGGAEEQIEVAERVKVAEIGPIGGNALIVFAPQHLGAAQRVLDGLAQK